VTMLHHPDTDASRLTGPARIFIRGWAGYSKLLFSMIAVPGFPATVSDQGGDVKR